MEWLSRFSFHRKMQFSFLMLILLPFIAVTFWAYSSVKQNVSDKLARSNEETLTVIANQLDKTIDSISFASVYFSQTYNPDILESFRHLKDAESFADFATFQSYMRLDSVADLLLMQSADANLKMMIVNKKNRMIMGDKSVPVFSALPPSFLRESSRLDEKETTALQWFASGEADVAPDYYYAARYIVDPRNREKLATMFVGIPQSYFHGLLDTGNPDMSFTLADRSGEIIAVKGKRVPADSGGMLTTRVSIPKTGWELTSKMPRTFIDSQINREFLVSLSLVGLFFFAFLILSLFWAGHINRPISMLRLSVKQYVGGKRDVRIPVKGKDEVAVLSAAFNQMLDDINGLLQKVESEQEEKSLLELKALAAQIRPHFLLNTLNSIKVSLLLSGDEPHGTMIDALMKLLRAYVHIDEPLKLAEECKVLGSYVQVMQIRNRMRIAFDYELGEGTESIELPRLLLQPIVENAIQHGLSARPENPTIDLSAAVHDRMLVIAIGDNGRGVSEENLTRLNRRMLGLGDELPSQPEKGVGLVNTARRLQVLYGDQARLKAAAREGGGTIFTFYIPIAIGKETDNHDEGHADR
ncbi:two-component system, sensor histidine kinase YesM [Cohnella sp. OV330]|uniref:sensor histidine kinase n=1 Tax=Cohnella sp. OV330 TaxID=1855288 RepID=UPI0008E0D17F|nr:histidine kinase [Cohnella sp. OV330]SFB30429.1 two-component system, sensor histidine kinase YesM [Cohnella sp. OV330]